MSDPDVFETHRHHLLGLAYHLLGSITEAEDCVQDAYIRWHNRSETKIDSPKAYLSQIITRLGLDRLKSARHQREHYVGTWLPEPWINAEDTTSNPENGHIQAEQASMALMMALERLTPLERAAYLLHDIFDRSYDEIAENLNRSPQACRQLTARARAHVQAAKPRYSPSERDQSEISRAFFTACDTGNLDEFTQLLHADAILHTDGGGKRPATLNNIYSAEKIARLFVGLSKKPNYSPPLWSKPMIINGMVGRLTLEADGELQSWTLEINEGQIQALYIVRNPDKLAHLWPHLPDHIRSAAQKEG